MTNICGNCKKKAENDFLLFKCDGCASHWCKACGDLSSSEVKVLQFKGPRILKFFCVNCLDFGTAKLLRNIITSKSDTITAKERIIELLERELAEKQEIIEQWRGKADQETKQQESYAVITAKGNHSCKEKENIPCIIVEPKSKQSSAKTRTELQDKIKPNKISVGVNMVKELKNGSILLKCGSKKATEKMRNEAEQTLGESYEISETRMLNPSITISNISKEMDEQEIIEAVRSQNESIDEGDHFRLKVLKTTRSNKSLYAVVECNGSAYQKLMSLKKINVGFNRCPVYESINLIRCYKCSRFNHLARVCSVDNEICSRCAGFHSSKDCTESEKSAQIACSIMKNLIAILIYSMK